jgi:hypothetical protein
VTDSDKRYNYHQEELITAVKSFYITGPYARIHKTF